MLQEILLSLSGHPSPLLSSANSLQNNLLSLNNDVISPSERALLNSLAHLSELHIKLSSYSSQIASASSSSSSSSDSSSVICRAVASAIDSRYLAAFRQKVLEVESTILKKDAALVGDYNIVPLTALVGEFESWTRRMEWLWGCVAFMLRERDTTHGEKKKHGTGHGGTCTGARLIDWLRGELQTGYRDVEDTARGLIRVAEVAWLRQVSAWILYGKLPSFGAGDFFVKRSGNAKDEGEFTIVPGLLPSFVTPSTAASMLFIGKSLNQIRAKILGGTAATSTDHMSSQLRLLSSLEHPLDSASFARTITEIRNFLSRTVLQRLLPLSKVLEFLELLRDFFLLRRGEFGLALTQQADEKIRSRWRRADNLAGYEKTRDIAGGSGLGGVVVKQGEVAAVLVRTWAAMGSMVGSHADEDEGLELARDLIRLTLAPRTSTTSSTEGGIGGGGLGSIAPTPFRNLLFSVPVVLTLQIPSPLDLFLSQSDLATYTAINSYLLSLRRAHLRLTDLWKITSLRRHHPAPPGPPGGSTRGGREKVKLLRQRYAARSRALRSAWATASAAIFFLGEMEGYLQTEVVAGLSDGFLGWLVGEDEGDRTREDKIREKGKGKQSRRQDEEEESDEDGEDDDIWLAESVSSNLHITNENHDESTATENAPKDPQTLATAHRIYLRTLVRRLLLTHQSFTDPLYELLVHIDHLVALIHRIHSVWSAADLEADVGVVDAFVDLEREERDLKKEIEGLEKKVKGGIEGLIGELRRLEGTSNDVGGYKTGNSRPRGKIGEDKVGEEQGAEKGKGDEDDDDDDDDDDEEQEEAFAMREMGEYVPRRVGGVDRLLMKLDFGSWFGGAARGGGGGGGGGGGVDEFGDLDEL